jgi:biofilm PGA synthesis N-glycosyltransferase PgaC
MAALDHRQTKQVPYVLITPAHNEEAHIGAAARSVVQQTLQPVRWVVVNDASSDRTSEIAKAWGAERPFIRVVDVRRAPGRDFGNKVRAFNAGLQCLRGLDYRYLGNLDADISLGPDYYARIIAELEQDPRIGIAGGMVQSKRGNRFVSQRVALDSVAGAVQFFRRECFEDVGGYPALQRGGIDAAVEILARKRGWKVRTFPAIEVREHRRTGSAVVGPMRARYRDGRRLYSLGYAFLFFLGRAVYRSMEEPPIVGSIAAVSGFLRSSLGRDRIVLPADVVAYLRAEQRAKIRNAFTRLLSLRRDQP